MVKTQMLLAQEGEHNPIIPEPAEFAVGLVAFLLLLWALWKYAVPRFEAIYAERSERIEGGIAKAEAAARIRDDARAEGQQILEEMRAQAQAESERIVSQGQAQLDAQKAQIIAELRADLGRHAVELASRVVGESLEDEARRRGTVDRFLDELEATSAPASESAKA